jgi:hypothetical protein
VQPAGNHALDQRALDRPRTRAGQLGAQKLQFARQGLLEQQVLAADRIILRVAGDGE